MFEKKKIISKKIMEGTVLLFPYTLGQCETQTQKEEEIYLIDNK